MIDLIQVLDDARRLLNAGDTVECGDLLDTAIGLAMQAPKITVALKNERQSDVRVVASHSENSPEYDELALEFYRGNERVADVLVSCDVKTKEPKLYITTDANPDEHTLEVFPLRPKSEAVK